MNDSLLGNTKALVQRIKEQAEHWAYMERIDHGDGAKIAQEKHAELVDQLADSLAALLHQDRNPV